MKIAGNLGGNWKLFSLAGIIAPILFIFIFTLAGFFVPGYDAVSMYISALPLTATGKIQTFNFILFGILTILFSIFVSTEFPKGKASKAGPTIFFLSGVCFFLNGPFVMDAMETHPSDSSVHGIIHNILGTIEFSLMPAACYVFFRRFHSDPQWIFYRWWTLAIATTLTVFVIFLTCSIKIPIFQFHFIAFIGIIQR